jgi:hypothetical protein
MLPSLIYAIIIIITECEEHGEQLGQSVFQKGDSEFSHRDGLVFSTLSVSL